MTHAAQRQPGKRQRINSDAKVSSKSSGELSVLDELDQRGGAKIRLPQRAGAALEAVLINTAGGLTGDDQIHWRARAGAHSRLMISTAASEKAYRSHGPDAHQNTELRADEGAWLAWLPQETIVFDGAALSRTLDVQLAEDASCLLCEALVFGRRASGERLHTGRVNDQWRVYRAGQLVHAEALKIDAGVDFDSDWLSGMGRDLSAIATVVFCSPMSEERLDLRANKVRERLPSTREATGGVSTLPGRLVVRLMAKDSALLRSFLLPILTELLDKETIPRVWYV